MSRKSVVWFGLSGLFALLGVAAYVAQSRPVSVDPVTMNNRLGEEFAAQPDESDPRRPEWARTTIQRLGPTQWYIKIWRPGWIDTAIVVPSDQRALVHGPPYANPGFQFTATCGSATYDSAPSGQGYQDVALVGGQCTGSIRIRRHSVPPAGELQIQVFLFK